MAENTDPENVGGEAPKDTEAKIDSEHSDKELLRNAGGHQKLADRGEAGRLNLRSKNRRERGIESRDSASSAQESERPEGVKPPSLDSTPDIGFDDLETLPDGGGWTELHPSDPRLARKSRDLATEKYYKELGQEIAGGVEAGSRQAAKDAIEFASESLHTATEGGRSIYKKAVEGAMRGAESLSRASKWFGDIFKGHGELAVGQRGMEEALGSEVTSRIYAEIEDIYTTHYYPATWDKWPASLRGDYERGLKKALREDYRKALRESYELGVTGRRVLTNTSEGITGAEDAGTSKPVKRQLELLKASRAIDEPTRRAELAAVNDELEMVTAELENWKGEVESELAKSDQHEEKIAELKQRIKDVAAILGAVKPATEPESAALIDPSRLEAAGAVLVQNGLLEQKELEDMVDFMRVTGQDLKVGNTNFGERLAELTHLYFEDDDRAVKRVRDLLRRNPGVYRSRTLDVSRPGVEQSVYVALMSELWSARLYAAGTSERIAELEGQQLSDADDVQLRSLYLQALKAGRPEQAVQKMPKQLEALRGKIGNTTLLDDEIRTYEELSTWLEELGNRKKELLAKKTELETPNRIDIAGALVESSDVVEWNSYLRELRAKLVYREQHFADQDEIIRGGDKLLLAQLKEQVPENLADLEKKWQWLGWKAGTDQGALVWRPLLTLFQRDMVRQHDYLREIHSYKQWIDGLESKPVDASERIQGLKRSADRLLEIQKNRDAWMDSASRYWESELRQIFERPEIDAEGVALLGRWSAQRKSLPTVWAHIDDLAGGEGEAKDITGRFMTYLEQYEQLSAELGETLEALKDRKDLLDRARLAQGMLTAVAMFNYEQMRSVSLPRTEVKGIVDTVSQWLKLDNGQLWDMILDAARNPLTLATITALAMNAAPGQIDRISIAEFNRATIELRTVPAVEQKRVEQPQAVQPRESRNFPSGFEKFGPLGEEYIEDYRKMENLTNGSPEMGAVIRHALSILEQIREQAKDSRDLTDIIRIDDQIKLNRSRLKINEIYEEGEQGAA